MINIRYFLIIKAKMRYMRINNIIMYYSVVKYMPLKIGIHSNIQKLILSL